MSFPARTARLAPPPRSMRAGASAWSPADRLRLAGSGAELLNGSPALAALEVRLALHGVRLDPGAVEPLHLELDAELSGEAYRLELSAEGARLTAAGAVGLTHALRTLTQWLALHEPRTTSATLDGLLVEDAPSFAERGVMLDVARDRRPTLDSLFELVARLASLKINRLQLYMEADFAYSFGELATRDRSPYSAEELRALDAHCAAHGVELVPNQQSFGHMHHWLRHAEWNALAEVPEGVEHPFSRHVEPFSLCPTDPGSLALLGRMFDELLPCFTSSVFNVGMDETFDLGEGRSAQACAARGKHSVYLDFLREVHELVSSRGKRMQFWGDIVLERPELCEQLPGDAIAMDWGYEADHPFEEELAALAASSHEFHVCPGTSSWNSFVGRTPNALGNLRSAARHGAAHGARGMLITDWGDRGHLQPQPISAPGWIAGAALAWNAEAEAQCDAARVATWLDEWWFEDRAGVLGSATVELGRVQELTGDACKNGSAAFFLVAFGGRDLDGEHFQGLTTEGIERGSEHLARALQPLARVNSSRADTSIVIEELELARDLAGLGLDLGRARLKASGVLLAQLDGDLRTAFAKRVLELARRHRQLWPKRQRPGGLEHSTSWLEDLLPILGHGRDRRSAAD